MKYCIRALLGLAAAATVCLATTSAIAAGAESAALIAVERQFVAGFNAGDVEREVATCAPTTAIVDDFPPHLWKSCAEWARAYAAWAKQNGVTNGTVVLGKPLHVDVDGSVAYVVNPTTFSSRHHGKVVTMTGSIWTVILGKSAGRWRITGWAWADH